MKRAPSLKLNFTKAALDNLPLPEPGQRVTYHDADSKQSVNGLQLRVTSNGCKSFYVFMRVGGKPERVRLGEHAYPHMSIDQAREEAKVVIAQIAKGESPAAKERERKAKSLTLAEAVERYVTDKRRRTDKLPLKERTKADYLAMLKPPRLTVEGKRTKGGCLARLANKSIYGITAADIKSLHAENLKHHSERQTFYALQTLAAVLRFYAVKIPHSPFSRDTPEAERLYIETAGVSATEPIEHLLKHLGDWWRALTAQQSPVSDYLMFLALTGCRPGEPLKVLVGDLVSGEIRLRDTKNRTDHVLLLSTQALAIAQRNASGKAAGDRLFPVTPAQANQLAHELSDATGIPFVPKMTRSLFASVADELVSSSALKRMMNHKRKDDITDTNYIRKQKETLRAGWQAVADYIEASAATNVVPLFKT